MTDSLLTTLDILEIIHSLHSTLLPLFHDLPIPIDLTIEIALKDIIEVPLYIHIHIHIHIHIPTTILLAIIYSTLLLGLLGLMNESGISDGHVNNI